MPTYTFPRPSVATDVVTLRVHEGCIEVLLIERAEAPKGWALPGGFLKVGGPRIEIAAARGAAHPDVAPTAADLDDVLGFVERTAAGEGSGERSDLDDVLESILREADEGGSAAGGSDSSPGER